MTELSLQTWELLLIKLISKTLDDSPVLEKTETAPFKRIVRSFLPLVPDGVGLVEAKGFGHECVYWERKDPEIPRAGEVCEIQVCNPFRGKAGESVWILYKAYDEPNGIYDPEGGIVECVLSKDAEPICSTCNKEQDASLKRVSESITVKRSIRFTEFPCYFRPIEHLELIIEEWDYVHEYERSENFVVRGWSGGGDLGETFLLYKVPSKGWACILRYSFAFHMEEFFAGYRPLSDGEIREYELDT